MEGALQFQMSGFAIKKALSLYLKILLRYKNK